MRLVLTLFVLLTLSACSMFQRDRPSVKTTDTSPKSATLSTGMSGFEVERLIGKPNRVTTEACKLGNKTSECLIWRYTERRQATIWFHGSDPLVVLFDLENVRQKFPENLMKGRIKRLQAALEAAHSAATIEQPLVCPLCERLIPASQRDAHHLIPKSRGGTATVWLHRICHRQVHALLTENELARQYHQVSLLREHPELAKFVRWVRQKPKDFFERTRKSNRLRT